MGMMTWMMGLFAVVMMFGLLDLSALGIGR